MLDAPVPIPKPKRVLRSYSQLTRAKVLELYAEGNSQPVISRQMGIPQQTIARWVLASKCHADGTRELANRIKDGVQQAVEKVTAKVTHEIESVITDSVRVGRLVLAKSEIALKSCNGRQHVSALVQASNAARNGINIARQALGLDLASSQPGSMHIGQVSIYSRQGDPIAALKSLNASVVVADCNQAKQIPNETSGSVIEQPTVIT